MLAAFSAQAASGVNFGEEAMAKLFSGAAVVICFCVFWSADAQNKPSTPVTVIISHATENYEEECPGTAIKHGDGQTWAVTVDASRCAKNGRTAFQASNALQKSASELTPGARIIGVMVTGDVLNPIPWAYQVFIHWERMFVLYRAD
jgi:hypothetical protein